MALGNSPLTWAELWRRYEAYYAARPKRVCGLCEKGLHVYCNGEAGTTNGYDLISCSCTHRIAVPA